MQYINLGILWEFFGDSLGILWEFFGNSLGILWEFFGNSLGILVEINIVLEYEWNLCFCQDFGVMQGRKEGSRILILRSAIASISHLKKGTFYLITPNQSKSVHCGAPPR